jgi:hypothetical protein
VVTTYWKPNEREGERERDGGEMAKRKGEEATERFSWDVSMACFYALFKLRPGLHLDFIFFQAV